MAGADRNFPHRGREAVPPDGERVASGRKLDPKRTGVRRGDTPAEFGDLDDGLRDCLAAVVDDPAGDRIRRDKDGGEE